MEMHQMSKEVTTHLREHIKTWPATKEDIVQACNNVSDIPEEERRWFIENLPEGTYHTPEEAEMVLQRGTVQG
jgi:hypothetical protein